MEDTDAKRFGLRCVASLGVLGTKFWKVWSDYVNFPNEIDLRDAIVVAARSAFRSLFSLHHGNYYYCSLITTGEAHSPVVTAWSWEALENATRGAENINEALFMTKWSYADSPYFAYGENFFAPVKELFRARPRISASMSDDEWSHEFQLRLDAMEFAMTKLDREGMFGLGEDRNRIVVLVEVMPPDASNTERAIRLNPPGALVEWLADVSEAT